MDDLRKNVRGAWLAVADPAMALRRELHAWPELGYQEIETTRRITGFLQSHGIACETFGNLTGAVALIDGGKPITAGLRVDIDALPVTENTGVSWSSKNTGVMHACGHDMHASIGASVAVLLERLKDGLPCNVKIIFQPAEECSPRGGARDMKDLGVLGNPEVSCLLGLHVWPEYPLGEIGIHKGPMMASSDKFTITVEGVSCHAAQPHKGVDAILAASDIITAAYKVLPRTLDVWRQYVLTIGEIASRGRYNIVCDHVEMAGTLRTFQEETRQHVRHWLAETVEKLPALYGGKGTLFFDPGYDAVVNHPELARVFAQHARNLLGAAAVHESDPPSLIAEDFSVLGKEVPSAYFHLGCGCAHSLHSEQFLAAEETLPIGVELVSAFFLSGDFAGFIQQYEKIE